jgi:hypothetical protein
MGLQARQVRLWASQIGALPLLQSATVWQAALLVPGVVQPKKVAAPLAKSAASSAVTARHRLGGAARAARAL